MINNSEFAIRLKKVMDYHQLSAAAFADKIKIQRSSISHLLSGRNKPSLDFVLKVVKEFDQVDIYWFLNGKGDFPKTDLPLSEKLSMEKVQKKIETKSNHLTSTRKVSSKSIERIVIFYEDGSFKDYLQ